MREIGLDIGTTSISAVVTEDGQVIHSITEQSLAAIKPEFAENRLQSVKTITEKVFSVKEMLEKKICHDRRDRRYGANARNNVY